MYENNAFKMGTLNCNIGGNETVVKLNHLNKLVLS